MSADVLMDAIGMIDDSLVAPVGDRLFGEKKPIRLKRLVGYLSASAAALMLVSLLFLWSTGYRGAMDPATEPDTTVSASDKQNEEIGRLSGGDSTRGGLSQTDRTRDNADSTQTSSAPSEEDTGSPTDTAGRQWSEPTSAAPAQVKQPENSTTAPVKKPDEAQPPTSVPQSTADKNYPLSLPLDSAADKTPDGSYNRVGVTSEMFWTADYDDTFLQMYENSIAAMSEHSTNHSAYDSEKGAVALIENRTQLENTFEWFRGASSYDDYDDGFFEKYDLMITVSLGRKALRLPYVDRAWVKDNTLYYSVYDKYGAEDNAGYFDYRDERVISFYPVKVKKSEIGQVSAICEIN